MLTSQLVTVSGVLAEATRLGVRDLKDFILHVFMHQFPVPSSSPDDTKGPSWMPTHAADWVTGLHYQVGGLTIFLVHDNELCALGKDITPLLKACHCTHNRLPSWHAQQEQAG